MDLEKTVSSRDNVVAAIDEITGRDDLKFGEVITMNIWRSVFQNLQDDLPPLIDHVLQTKHPNGQQFWKGKSLFGWRCAFPGVDVRFRL